MLCLFFSLVKVDSSLLTSQSNSSAGMKNSSRSLLEIAVKIKQEMETAVSTNNFSISVNGQSLLPENSSLMVAKPFLVCEKGQVITKDLCGKIFIVMRLIRSVLTARQKELRSQCNQLNKIDMFFYAALTQIRYKTADPIPDWILYLHLLLGKRKMLQLHRICNKRTNNVLTKCY